MKRRSKVIRERGKARGRKPAKLKRSPELMQRSSLASLAAGEQEEISRLARELNEARDRESATSDVLQLISNSEQFIRLSWAGLSDHLGESHAPLRRQLRRSVTL